MKSLALIGAGYMAGNHARVVAESGRASIAVVCDVDETRARRLAQRHGARWTRDPTALEGVDGAIIATSTESHAAIAVPLLQGGLPLLVEKPLAARLEDVEAIVAAAEASGTPLMCGFVERYNPVVQLALSLLDDAPVHLLAVRHSPAAPRIRTSVVHDLLIHDVDLASVFAGRVTGINAATWTPPGLREPEVADCSLVHRDGGTVSTLSASRSAQRKVRELRISTPTVYVELDLLRNDITVFRHVRQEEMHAGTMAFREETMIDIPFVRHAGEPLLVQLHRLLDLLDGEADPAEERATLLEPHRVVAQIDALTIS